MPTAQTYKIPSYQSGFDALISVNVPLDSIVDILKTSDLDLNSELTGKEIIYEDTQVSEVKGGQKASFTTSGISEYVTNSAQNIFDVCLMTISDLNKIVLLVSQNEIFNSINDYPNGVKSVIYNNTDITDSGLKLAFKRGGINITTGIVGTASVGNFLLKEDGFYLLQEDGFKIKL